MGPGIDEEAEKSDPPLPLIPPREPFLLSGDTRGYASRSPASSPSLVIV